MKILLIGGHFDGHRIDVNPENVPQHISMAVPPKFIASHLEPRLHDPVKRIDYNIISHGGFLIGVCSGISKQEALRMLLSKYIGGIHDTGIRFIGRKVYLSPSLRDNETDSQTLRSVMLNQINTTGD